MSAPTGNENRKGKTGQIYNISRLKCGTCNANKWCPVVSSNPNDTCVFIKKMKKWDLNSIDGIKNIRRQLIQESLVQLQVMSIVSEAQGESSKEMITFRKILMEQLAGLERDEFDQDRKKTQETKEKGFLVSLISEVRKQPALSEGDVVEVDFKVEDMVKVE